LGIKAIRKARRNGVVQEVKRERPSGIHFGKSEKIQADKKSVDSRKTVVENQEETKRRKKKWRTKKLKRTVESVEWG